MRYQMKQRKDSGMKMLKGKIQKLSAIPCKMHLVQNMMRLLNMNMIWNEYLMFPQ